MRYLWWHTSQESHQVPLNNSEATYQMPGTIDRSERQPFRTPSLSRSHPVYRPVPQILRAK